MPSSSYARNEKTILVVGASGFLGRSVSSKLARDHSLVLTHGYHPQHAASLPFDIFKDDPEKLLNHRNISIVLMMARLYNPNEPGSVVEREAAFRRFLEACGGLRVVMASTDAVFDGERGHYKEWMERHPVTEYGKHTMLYEDMLMECCRDACIIRMSYLYGYSQGRLDRRLLGTRAVVQRGERVPCFDDMFKSPLEVGQAAEAVVRLTISGHRGPVHVAGPRLSLYEFHRQAMQALGERAELIEEAKMPVGQGLARDTSLNTDLMTQLTGLEARPIAQSLLEASNQHGGAPHGGTAIQSQSKGL